LIIPITVLLTTCHFLSVLVPLFVAALLAGAIREGINVRRYSILLIATMVACATTPMLPGMLRAMWDYQFSDPMLDAGVVAEFQRVWAGPLGWISVSLLALWLYSVWKNRAQLRTGEIVWALGCLALLIRLGRFAPVFAPIGAATLAASLPRFKSIALSRRAARMTVACLIVIGVIRLTITFPKFDTSLESWLNRHGPDTPGYPCGAADYVAANIAPGRVINEFSWGGFLGWRLGAVYPILLDGRTQLYTPDFWRLTYGPDPMKARPILEKSRSVAAVLPAERSRFRAILCDMGWRSIYRDARAEVLIPPDSPAADASIP
jgi:hypothetical protein